MLADTPALPVDLLRIGVGLLGLLYMILLSREVEEISGPAGLVPHELLRKVVPPVALSIFQPGLDEPFFRIVFAIGALACVGLTLGLYPRLCALIAYGITVSHLRWNLMVAYVDDMVIHLLLFWMLLLPSGTTLSVLGWRSARGFRWEDWLRLRVPALTVRAFMLNVCVVYTCAGLFKLTSPMWRDGFALYAVLRTGIAFGRDLWGPHDLIWLRPLSYAALLSELSLGVLLLFPRGSIAKRIGGVLQIAFHLGIIATMNVGIANLAMLFSSVVFFGDELVARLRGSEAAGAEEPSVQRVSSSALTGMAALVAIVAAVMPGLEVLRQPAQAALWAVGLSQNYRLFDWIDETNYRIELQGSASGTKLPSQAVNHDEFLPLTNRGRLLLLHLKGRPWLDLFAEQRTALSRAVLERATARYCRRHPSDGSITLQASVRRVTEEDPDLALVSRELLVRFRCAGGRARICRTFLAPHETSLCDGAPREALR